MKRSSVYVFFLVFVMGFVVYGRSKVRKGKSTPHTKQEEANSVVPSRPYKKTENISSFSKDIVAPNFDEAEFIKKRRELCVNFVEKGLQHLQANELSKALSDFCHNKDFIQGEVYLFVFDYDGVCLAHGGDSHYLWKNMYDYKDKFGIYSVRGFIEKAKSGGGWMTYEWRNAAKVSYVKQFSKDGKNLAVGAGFYPMSKRDSVVKLVKAGVGHFYNDLGKGESVKDSFSELNYPTGSFMYGDLYIFCLDFDGNILVQADKPGLIGENALEYKDSKGKFINKEIIEKLKKTPEGVWVEYESKGVPKITYAEKVTDKTGKNYFVACGYYPKAGRKGVITLVKDAYTYMKLNGLTQASRAFTNKERDEFRRGDLYVFVYDYEGNCKAHGDEPDYVGVNRYNVKDEDGHYYVRSFIDKAKEGGGWVDYKLNNVSRYVYIMPIKVGADRYLIGSGIYPLSKPEKAYLLVKRAASFLENNSKEKVFRELVERDGKFIAGDLDLFIFDFKGICYTYGQDLSLIWKNLYDEKDQDGRQFVKLFINTAKEGGGNAVYKKNNAHANAYVLRVDKADESFVVGISFFT